MILNGRGRELPVRGCEDGQPRAGEAVAADWAGRQPAGPARGDAAHHRLLPGLHQGDEAGGCLTSSPQSNIADRVCSAGVGGDLRQHEDAGRLDGSGGRG